MEKRCPLSGIPAIACLWRISDADISDGDSITLLSYAAPKEGQLIGESLITRKYLSFDPKPTFWGKSETAQVSTIFVDRARRVHLGFRNKPGAPNFYFTEEVLCPASFLVSVKDKLGKEKRRYFIVFNLKETKITEFAKDTRGDFTQRKWKMCLEAADPDYAYFVTFPQNDKAPE